MDDTLGAMYLNDSKMWWHLLTLVESGKIGLIVEGHVLTAEELVHEVEASLLESE